MAIVKEGAEIARVTEPGAVRQQRLRIFAEGSGRACRSEANYSQPLGNSPFIYKALVVMHGPKVVASLAKTSLALGTNSGSAVRAPQSLNLAMWSRKNTTSEMLRKPVLAAGCHVQSSAAHPKAGRGMSQSVSQQKSTRLLSARVLIAVMIRGRHLCILR